MLFIASLIACLPAQSAATIYKRAESAVVVVETASSIGTGFVVGDGTFVVTCNHVVRGRSSIDVKAKSSHRAFIVYSDATRDIAVLRIGTQLANKLVVSTANTPPPGAEIYAIGNPEGFLTKTITQGIVGGIRNLGDFKLIQFSAQASKGSSGGPLLDRSGKVVGMMRSGIDGSDSFNFAVTAYDLRGAIEAAKFSGGALGLRRPGDEPAGDLKVLGKLGQATEKSPIYAQMSTSSRVYYRVKQYEYIVVVDSTRDNWFKVLLQNGMYGYIPSAVVAKQPFEVTTRILKQPAVRSVSQVAEVVLAYLGNRAVKGGTSLEKGIDSGPFVQKIFSQFGVKLPAEPSKQAKVGKIVTKLEELMKGDRVYFWGKAANKIDRVGIYLGNGYFVMANPLAGEIGSYYLGEPKWLSILVAARR